MWYLTALIVGPLSMLASGASSAQNGGMMNGGHMGGGWMGGYGGYWWPILLVVVVGIVVWGILQRRK